MLNHVASALLLSLCLACGIQVGGCYRLVPAPRLDTALSVRVDALAANPALGPLLRHTLQSDLQRELGWTIITTSDPTVAQAVLHITWQQREISVQRSSDRDLPDRWRQEIQCQWQLIAHNGDIRWQGIVTSDGFHTGLADEDRARQQITADISRQLHSQIWHQHAQGMEQP